MAFSSKAYVAVFGKHILPAVNAGEAIERTRQRQALKGLLVDRPLIQPLGKTRKYLQRARWRRAPV